LPELVYEQVAEVTGRVSVDGEELEPLNEDEVKACLKEAYAAGIRGVAVCLMHAYRYTKLKLTPLIL
jgi:5-oxoprolinase (ATP-hydrolysing)